MYYRYLRTCIPISNVKRENDKNRLSAEFKQKENKELLVAIIAPKSI